MTVINSEVCSCRFHDITHHQFISYNLYSKWKPNNNVKTINFMTFTRFKASSAVISTCTQYTPNNHSFGRRIWSNLSWNITCSAQQTKSRAQAEKKFVDLNDVFGNDDDATNSMSVKFSNHCWKLPAVSS
jgi:hypothetical protein